MTALIIFGGLVLGWRFTAAEHTSVLTGWLTVYIAIFAAGLATATIFAIISRNVRTLIGAGVLILNFAGSHLSWASPDPITNQMVLDLATAMWFAFTGAERWQFGIAGVYAASVGLGLLTLAGIVPGYLERPPVFLASCYPDLASGLGHIASITLGLASGDWGRRVKAVASMRPAFAGGSSLAMRLLRTRP